MKVSTVKRKWFLAFGIASVLFSGCDTPSTHDGIATKTLAVTTSPPPAVSDNRAVASGPSPVSVPEVPGELLVKFRSTGAEAVTDCVATRLEQKKSMVTATMDHSSSLDELMSRFGVGRAKTLLRARKGLTTAQARAMMRDKIHSKIGSPDFEAPDLTNVYLLRMSSGEDVDTAVKAFADDPHVEYVEPNYRVEAHQPDDPFWWSEGTWGQPYADLWNLHIINADGAWQWSQGAGVVVAVVDTGVDSTHLDMADNIWNNSNEILNGIDDDQNGFIDDIHGWDMVNHDNDPMDDMFHGTHVAGIIAAQDNNSYGIVGVSPDAEIMAVKVLDRDGGGDLFSAAQGLLYAAENGADIINSSWGCADCPPNLMMEETIENVHAMGVTVVFSAGNASRDIESATPNNSPYVITVSGSDPGDGLYSRSCFGEVDVAAPGAGFQEGPPSESPDFGVLSLKSVQSRLLEDDWIVSDDFCRLAGTSMAAPHVSGLAALILSAHPDYTPEMVRQVIRSSAIDVGDPGFDKYFGYGRIDAEQATTFPTTPSASLITGPVHDVGVGSVPVTGFAVGAGFDHYLLEYGVGESPSSWNLLAEGTTEVNGGVLGYWEVEEGMSGAFTLRLSVTGRGGVVFEDRQRVRIDRFYISAPSDAIPIRAGDIVDIEGTAADPDFQYYTIEVAEVFGDPVEADITLPNEGQAPVEHGLLATWNTGGISTGHYKITVTQYYSSKDPESEATYVFIDEHLHEGWPVSSDRPTLTPVIPLATGTSVDLDGDGGAEILLGNGDVTALRHDGTALPGWPQSVDPDNDGSYAQRSPAVGDIDGDGRLEVVAGNSSGLLFAWETDGTLKDGYPIEDAPDGDAAVALADVDNDGVLDIVAHRAVHGLRIRKGTGELLPGWPQTVGAGLPNGPTIADLDGDGTVEIIVSHHTTGPLAPNPVEQIAVFTPAGSAVPGFPKSIEGISGHAVGDLDGDGDLEIVVSAHMGMVYAYHHDGSSVTGWPFTMSTFNYSVVNHPTVGDINGDGHAEILIGDWYEAAERSYSRLHVLDEFAASVFSPRIEGPIESARRGYVSPALVDMDADGLPEILVSRNPLTDSKAFKVFRGDGTEMFEYSRYITTPPAAWDTTPAVADTDGDGLLEVVWTGFTTLYHWDFDIPASPAPPWPMYMGNAQHTGYNEPAVGVTIPALIEAEDYVRYYDTTPGNTGGGCDTGDDVDKEITGDVAGGNCNVGWAEPGEWLEYDIHAGTTQIFDITLRLASAVSDKSCRIEIDGVDMSGSVTAPNDGWQTYEDRVIRHVAVAQGNHVVRVYMETDSININYIEFAPASPLDIDVDLGTEHTTTSIVVDGSLILGITDRPDWGWTPGSIVVGFSSIDGLPLDGMSVTVDGETRALSGWWQQLTIPYTHQDRILLELNSAEERTVSVQWWAT